MAQEIQSTVLKSAAVQLVSHVRYCRAKPCRKVEGKEGWTRIVFCLDPITSPSREHWRHHCGCRKGEEIRPRAKRPPRTRSSEAPDTDARERERLARRVEQHSQRMAELLRRGVLEPSLAYAFLMTKGGQRIPQVKSKAKLGQAAGRRQVKELRLPLTRHRHVSRQKDPRGETMEPLMLVRRYELRDEPDALSSAGHLSHGPARMSFFFWTLLHGPCTKMV